jgi:hypothetical protein
MRGPCGGFRLDAGTARCGKIHTFEEALTESEQDGRCSVMHLFDKALVQILLDDVDVATV